jgi:multidrug resistance efflux pump
MYSYLMRRRLPFLRLVLGLSAALLLTVVAGFWLVRIDRVATAPGRLAGGSVPVRAPVPGRIASVSVAAGAAVEAGQPLLRLETAALEAEAEQLAVRLETLQEQAKAQREEGRRLAGEVHPREREQAERAVERGRLELAQAEVKAQAMANLGAEGLAGRLDVEEAELARQLAAMALEEAQRAVPLLATRQETQLSEIAISVSALEGEFAEEQSRLRETRRLLDDSTVVAEAAGIVVGNDLEELQGRQVAAGDELLRLAVAPAERFEGTLTDTGRALARPGLTVKIRMDGYPWLIHGTLGGRVERISDRRDTSGGFPVTISLDRDSAPGDLYEGMRGEARVVIEHKVSLGRLLLERLTEPGSS